jgi:hypothetical protein
MPGIISWLLPAGRSALGHAARFLAETGRAQRGSVGVEQSRQPVIR